MLRFCSGFSQFISKNTPRPGLDFRIKAQDNQTHIIQFWSSNHHEHQASRLRTRRPRGTSASSG